MHRLETGEIWLKSTTHENNMDTRPFSGEWGMRAEHGRARAPQRRVVSCGSVHVAAAPPLLHDAITLPFRLTGSLLSET